MRSAREVAAAPSLPACPCIEIFQKETRDGTLEIRIDACFRAAYRNLKDAEPAVTLYAYEMRDTISLMIDSFRQVQGLFAAHSINWHRDGENALTCARACDLKKFVQFASETDFDFGQPQLVEEGRQAVAAAIAAGFDLSEKNDEVDEAAIAGLRDPEFRRRLGGSTGSSPHPPA